MNTFGPSPSSLCYEVTSGDTPLSQSLVKRKKIKGTDIKGSITHHSVVPSSFIDSRYPWPWKIRIPLEPRGISTITSKKEN